jgi:serine/threonine protein kinase
MDEKYDLDDDGAPVWIHRAGGPLPGGSLAVRRLGVGLRSESWLGWSTELWCPVVVKMTRPHQTRNRRTIRSLRREITALAGAYHPGLPRLLGDGTAESVPHIVVEYVAGPTLDERLDQDGPMPATDAALSCAHILAAVTSLHRRGLAHLDLKPANIVLSPSGPVIIDFGSTRQLGSQQPLGHPVGTAGYAAPEQEACHRITATMDCYSAGSVLYEALTCEATGPDHRFASLPPHLCPVVSGLLEANPDRRMTTIEAMFSLAEVIPADRRPWPRWADRHLWPEGPWWQPPVTELVTSLTNPWQE